MLLSVFEQLMGLPIDKDGKTVVYKMTKEQNRPIIVLIVDNPEVFHVSSPYEVIIIKRIVVACKDFCVIRGGLSEIRTIKNAYSEEMLEEQESFVESKSGDRVNLEELLFHLDENRRLKNIPGLKEHFWGMSVVDILIDNNDRNNGNRGLIFNFF